MKKERLTKSQYFKLRYLQAKENGNIKKANYYKSRLNQLNESLDKYCEAVRKTVNVLNAPIGTVNQKQSYINEKLIDEGWTKEEANNIFLESLYK